MTALSRTALIACLAGWITSDAIPATEPMIEITINPEGRLNAERLNRAPPVSACGTPAEIWFKVINQGFITAKLEVLLIGNTEASIGIVKQRLTGQPTELRKLEITLLKPEATDVTILFSLRGIGAPPRGRDRVHMIARCEPISAA